MPLRKENVLRQQPLPGCASQMLVGRAGLGSLSCHLWKALAFPDPVIRPAGVIDAGAVLVQVAAAMALVVGKACVGLSLCGQLCICSRHVITMPHMPGWCSPSICHCAVHSTVVHRTQAAGCKRDSEVCPGPLAVPCLLLCYIAALGSDCAPKASRSKRHSSAKRPASPR